LPAPRSRAGKSSFTCLTTCEEISSICRLAVVAEKTLLTFRPAEPFRDLADLSTRSASRNRSDLSTRYDPAFYRVRQRSFPKLVFSTARWPPALLMVPLRGPLSLRFSIDRRLLIRRSPIPLSRSRAPRRFMLTFSRRLPKEHARARAHESARSARCFVRAPQHLSAFELATTASHEARNLRCRCAHLSMPLPLRSLRAKHLLRFCERRRPFDPRSRNPALDVPKARRFLRLRTFETLGFWPLSRGGQIRVRGDSMFCERGCSPIFRPGCTGSTVRSRDRSETRDRMSTSPCPCAFFRALSSPREGGSRVRADAGYGPSR
jgi:hypothetical protein